MTHQPVHIEKTCLNCANKYQGKYCNECGQAAEVERVTAKHLFHETVHILTHYEKGFLHTIWHFLVKPGTASIKYINGKRKEYQKPVSYILILTGLYILVHNYIIGHYQYQYQDWQNPLLTPIEQSNIFLRTHFTPFVFIILLTAAFVIYLILGKPTFNFVEILTLCLYGGGTYFLMLTISDILLGMMFRTDIISMNVFLYQTILSSVYNFWFSYDIFKKASVRFLWLKLVAVSILIAIIGYSIMSYLPLLLI